MKKRVLILMGTRPEVIKLAPLILALRKHRRLEPMVCLTGQHAHMATQMLDHFGLSADDAFKIERATGNLTGLVAGVAAELARLIAERRPDLIVVQGDTTSAMLGAVAGFYERIPVAHVEAGLRSFDMDQPFPEEFNRRVISLGADLHFCPTRVSMQNLTREGVPKKKIQVTGNTCIDALLWTLEHHSRIPAFSPGFRGILVTAHRRENWESGIGSLCKVILRILKSFPDVEVLLPVHKNPIVQKVVREALDKQPRARLVEPMDYGAFSWAMKDAHLIITDSGGVQEEALALGTPVLVTRNVTERPEVLTGGTVKLLGNSPTRLWQEAKRLLDDKPYYQTTHRARFPFGKGDAALKIAFSIDKFLK